MRSRQKDGRWRLRIDLSGEKKALQRFARAVEEFHRERATVLRDELEGLRWGLSLPEEVEEASCDQD